MYAPGVAGEALEYLAVRLLHAVGDTPVSLGQGGKLAVSASIGHAAFPLTPHGLRPGWEQALSLTDMALYSAKNQGRKRAIGITAVAAGDAAALRSIEADFEQALQQGRVTTRTLLQRAPETAESA